MTASQAMTFTLLGTGSSGGVPRVGNDWGACDPAEPKNRRRRCSALLDIFDTSEPDTKSRILIDTSPDLREQLLSEDVQHLDAVVFTHDHADQTHGIDDIRALAIRQRRQIPAYMDAPTSETLIPKFRYCFEGKGGYPPILDLQPMIEPYAHLNIGGRGGALEMTPLIQEHGSIQSLGFRIGKLAYCNDVSDLPAETLAQLESLDTLVIDALRYTPHPTHAHLERVLDWVDKLQPARTALTNLHVDMDYATLVRDLPAGVEPAFDGWSVTLDL